MNIKRLCVTLSYAVYSIILFSQETSSLRDTLNEVIVFEYDTVYLKPDTLRVTDTIVEIEKAVSSGKKKSSFNRFFSKISSQSFLTNNALLTGHSFLSHITPNSISFGVAPYINGNESSVTTANATNSQSVVNKSFALLWNYNYSNFVLSVGTGFTRYHEKQQELLTYYSANIQTNTHEPYDSLFVTDNISSDYYYNYLNVYALFGYSWVFNKKLSLLLSGGFVTDFLIGYKQGNTNNPSSSVIRKTDVRAAFAPSLNYKITRNFGLFVAPFYQRSLVNDKKYPYSSFQKMGVGAGFNIFLQ